MGRSLDDSGNGLQGQSWTNYNYDGSEYKDERCAPEHEHVPSGTKQGSFGAEDEAKDNLKRLEGGLTAVT